MQVVCAVGAAESEIGDLSAPRRIDGEGATRLVEVRCAVLCALCCAMCTLCPVLRCPSLLLAELLLPAKPAAGCGPCRSNTRTAHSSHLPLPASPSPSCRPPTRRVCSSLFWSLRWAPARLASPPVSERSFDPSRLVALKATQHHVPAPLKSSIQPTCKCASHRQPPIARLPRRRAQPVWRRADLQAQGRGGAGGLWHALHHRAPW